MFYVCSSPFVVNKSDDEVTFVTAWLDALRGSADERLQRLGVMVRPHPRGNRGRREVVPEARAANVRPSAERSRLAATSARRIRRCSAADFYDSLVHSAAVVGINTTAMIEARSSGRAC